MRLGESLRDRVKEGKSFRDGNPWVIHIWEASDPLRPQQSSKEGNIWVRHTREKGLEGRVPLAVPTTHLQIVHPVVGQQHVTHWQQLDVPGIPFHSRSAIGIKSHLADPPIAVILTGPIWWRWGEMVHNTASWESPVTTCSGSLHTLLSHSFVFNVSHSSCCLPSELSPTLFPHGKPLFTVIPVLVGLGSIGSTLSQLTSSNFLPPE